MPDADFELYDLLDRQTSPSPLGSADAEPTNLPDASAEFPLNRLPAASDTNIESHSSPTLSARSDQDDGIQQEPLPRSATDGESQIDVPLSQEALQVSPLSGNDDDEEAQLSSTTHETYWETLHWWLPEILATVLSLICFTAIVVVLLIYDRRAVSSLELPYSLTLNGVLALLATIGRISLCTPVYSALLQEMWLFLARESAKSFPTSRIKDIQLFAEAPTGVMGSLAFLANLQRPKLLGAFGCVITIMALGFGTFVQQLLAYEVMLARGSIPNGNIPRSENWLWAPDVLGSELTLSLKAAIWSGAMSTIPVEPVEPFCGSGNCSWPTTPSVAVCGACKKQDFSLVDCYPLPPSMVVGGGNCKPGHDGIGCEADIMCNYTMGLGRHVELYNSAKYSLRHAAKSMGPDNQVLAFYSKTRTPYLHYDDYGNATPTKAYLLALDLLRLPYSVTTKTNGSQYSDTKYEPLYHGCELWLCVQHLNVSVQSGRLHQIVSATSDLLRPIIALNTPGPLSYFVPRDDEPSLGQQQEYYIANQLADSFMLFAEARWKGSLNVSDIVARGEGDLLRATWNGTSDPDAWIANLATSLTNFIRVNNHTERAEYNGMQYELGVKVRWLWIIYPAVLVLASIVILVATVIRTAHSPVHSWKGSPLTLLLLELDVALIDSAIGQIEKRGGVEKAIGKQKVRMVRRSDGRRKLKVA